MRRGRTWTSRFLRFLHRERRFQHLPSAVRQRGYRRPAQAVVAAFAVAVTLGTALLMLPNAHARGEETAFVEALFTATSAVCVVGLSVVDTETHWSLFGELTILGLIQVGGLGIMTLASLLGIVVIRRFGIRMQLSLQTETRTFNVGDVREIAGRIFLTSVVCEGIVASILVARLLLAYDQPLWYGVYVGVFHAVSAFNNAGFSLYSESLTRFSGDPWIIIPVMVAVIVGGLGFPVFLELQRRFRQPRHWSLHTKLTLSTTGVLLLSGSFAITALEWSNPATLGPMGWGEKLLAGTFHGIMPRSGGLNVIDVGAMSDSSLFATIMLMFVGGGSGSTAGGIKVTTFAVLWIVVWAEARGHPHVHVFGRQLSAGAIRQSLSLTFLSMTFIVFSTVYVLEITEFAMERVLFEMVSAVGVVGLSTGITADLPPQVKLLMVGLMFAGRIGPITFASALALRERGRRYDLPDARPIIG